MFACGHSICSECAMHARRSLLLGSLSIELPIVSGAEIRDEQDETTQR